MPSGSDLGPEVPDCDQGLRKSLFIVIIKYRERKTDGGTFVRLQIYAYRAFFKTDGWTNERMDGQMDGWMEGCTDGRTDRDGRIDEEGWMEGWMGNDRRTDGRTS